MRVLVTGGAGFIGSNFVHRSLATRRETAITVLDSLTYAGSKENLAGALDEITFVNGDIRDEGLVTNLVKKSDLVIHFAAESHNDNALSNPELFFDVNLGGTVNLIQACVRHGTRFHHISTDEVYGDLPLDSSERFTELSPYKPSSPYSASKAASDHAVRAWIRSYGLEGTISNCSNNFGPRQHKEKFIPSAIARLRAGKPPILYGSGENVRDWIHVDDHTDAVWKVIDFGNLGETYLVGADDEWSNVGVLALLLKFFGKPMDFIEHVDDRPGHDLRYALDSSKLRTETGWLPSRPKLQHALLDMLENNSI